MVTTAPLRRSVAATVLALAGEQAAVAAAS